jgi:hypothetical protein
MSSSTDLPQTVLVLPLTGLCVATGYSRIKNAIPLRHRTYQNWPKRKLRPSMYHRLVTS